MGAGVVEGDWVRVVPENTGLGRVVEVDEERGCVEVVMQNGRVIRVSEEWLAPVDFLEESVPVLRRAVAPYRLNSPLVPPPRSLPPPAPRIRLVSVVAAAIVVLPWLLLCLVLWWGR